MEEKWILSNVFRYLFRCIDTDQPVSGRLAISLPILIRIRRMFTHSLKKNIARICAMFRYIRWCLLYPISIFSG
jgi:hypothetical protein